MYHALIIEESLSDKKALANYQIVKTTTMQGKHYFILEFSDIDEFIENFQKNLINTHFFHIYDNGISMRVVFKEMIFRMNPNNKNTWLAAQKYGRSLAIPQTMLNFYPTRIKEEENL